LAIEDRFRKIQQKPKRTLLLRITELSFPFFIFYRGSQKLVNAKIPKLATLPESKIPKFADLCSLRFYFWRLEKQKKGETGKQGKGHHNRH
jgi:hypothetical protein